MVFERKCFEARVETSVEAGTTYGNASEYWVLLMPRHVLRCRGYGMFDFVPDSSMEDLMAWGSAESLPCEAC